MKYIKTLVGAIVAVALFVTTVSAAPATNAPSTSGDLGVWSFAVAGGGSSALNNNHQINSSTVGGTFELGHSGEFILPIELGVRQTIGYSDVAATSAAANLWSFKTAVFNDWTLIKLGNVEFDGGANVAYAYGNATPDWTAGPEVVARLYLKKDVDLFGRVEYPYDLTRGQSQDSLTYTIGLRVRF